MRSRIAVVVVVVVVVVAVAVSLAIMVVTLARTDQQRTAGGRPSSSWFSTGDRTEPGRKYILRTQDVVQVTVQDELVDLGIERGQRRGTFRVTASADDICRVLNCTVLADSVEPVAEEIRRPLTGTPCHTLDPDDYPGIATGIVCDIGDEVSTLGEFLEQEGELQSWLEGLDRTR